jgi:drug/metabolite transporter (DMT)-like permease
MSDPAPSAHTPSRSPRDAEPGRPGAVGLVALSAAAFGAMAIFARWAYEAGVDLWGILLPRFAIAAACFALIARLASVAPAPRGRRAGLAAMGAGYVAQATCFFAALQFIPAGLVALLLYLFPLFVVLLARALGLEPITGRRVLALAASLAGTVLALGTDPLAGGAVDPRGVALAVAAAAVYAGYILLGATATQGVHPIAASSRVMASGTAILAAIVLVRLATGRPVAFPSDAAGWGAVLAAATVSTVVAVSAFFAGLKVLGPSRASMISTLEPVVTVALAALLLGEVLGPSQFAGGALVLAGAWLLATERH